MNCEKEEAITKDPPSPRFCPSPQLCVSVREGERGRQREAEGGRGRQREAEGKRVVIISRLDYWMIEGGRV